MGMNSQTAGAALATNKEEAVNAEVLAITSDIEKKLYEVYTKYGSRTKDIRIFFLSDKSEAFIVFDFKAKELSDTEYRHKTFVFDSAQKNESSYDIMCKVISKLSSWCGYTINSGISVVNLKNHITSAGPEGIWDCLYIS